MKKTIIKPTVYTITSFILPFLIILIALAGLEIAPFGDHTLVISDANGLYINTLSYAGRMLKGLEGITYSFEKGMGGNMMGHLNGILLTPFAFLFSLSDIVNYPTAFSFVSAFNFSLAGLTMYILLADLHGHKRSNLIFSTSYALMGFQVANVFQAYFFSAAPILPIMALGLKKLFDGKNPALYILSVAYALFSNAYFGFMLCAASVLFFVTGVWYCGDALKGRRVRLCLNYGISSLCGGLLSALMWLPAFLSLKGGRLEQTSVTDFSFWENMPLLEIGAKLFTGANSTAELVNGLPNIFVGIFPIALVLLFFLSKKTETRKKKAAAFLLGVYLLSFWIVAFNMLMHAGTTTNWFNYRYSYIFSFILLVVAAEQWQSFEEISASDVKRCLSVLIVSVLLIFSKKYEFVQGGAVVLDIGILILILLAWRMHRRAPEKNPRKLFEIIALILVCVNLFLNYRICTKSILEWETKLSDYQKVVSLVDPLVHGAKSADDDFYRIEIDEQRSETCGNDPMLYGYDGVGHGGSNERDFVRKALSKLGVPWFDMRNYYAKGVPAAVDTFLGLRYIIAKNDLSQEKDYERLVSLGEWSIYKNSNALPVAFTVQGDLDTVETGFEDVFDNLNRTWRAVSGTDRDVFTEEGDIVFEAHQYMADAPISSKDAREIVRRQDDSISALTSEASASAEDSSSASEPASVSDNDPSKVPENMSYISYTWIAKEDGPIYIYNKSGLSEISGAASPVLQFLGCYHVGDTVTGYLQVPNGIVTPYLFEDVAGRFRAAYADLDALHELSDIVRSRPCSIEKLKDSHLCGEYTAEDGQLLMFTIPWDEGWTCTVDGQPVELKQVLGVFMAGEVPAVTHSFEMKYVPAGLNMGITISACALVFTLLYVLVLRKRFDIFSYQNASVQETAPDFQSEVSADDPI